MLTGTFNAFVKYGVANHRTITFNYRRRSLSPRGTTELHFSTTPHGLLERSRLESG
jgi:hypothetical protein